MNPPQIVRLRDITREVSAKPGLGQSLPVYSVTKHAGFVPSLEFFSKQVFSRDTSGYKLVVNGQLAYATIHLDEGALGLLTSVDAALISPMYTVFEVNPKRVHAPYLWRIMKAPQMLAKYQRLGKGSVHRRKAISFERLASLEIPLPDLSEQRRIADILDKADGIRRKRKEAIALTEELLRSAFLEMFGDPVTNPKRWKVGDFGDVLASPLRNGLSPATGGTHKAQVLTLSAITGAGFNASAVKEGMFAFEPWPDVRVDKRDFLICRGNGNRDLVGRGAYPEGADSAVVFPDTMIAARVDPNILVPSVLVTLWNSSLVRRQLEAGARTTNGTFKINQRVVESVQIIIPPAEKQRTFERVASYLRLYLSHQQCSRGDGERLFDSLAARAFSDGLVGTSGT